MNRLVYSVFKAIILSILFVFAFDMIFYLYRALSLNARMESLSTSLKKVVMENNYLPSEDAELYQQILYQMAADFNGVDNWDASNPSSLINNNASNNFIAGMWWNYSEDADTNFSISAKRSYYTGNSWTSTTTNIVKKQMDDPADYGDIMVVQLSVTVYQPMWGWASSINSIRGQYNYSGQSGQDWNRNATARTNTFVYTYYVPCMKYKTVN